MMRSGPHRSNDAGYSLTEMLVVIMMLALVMGSITAVVITSLKHQKSLADRASVLASTRTALERIDRDIRAADPLCYATGTEVAMYEQNPLAGTVRIVDYSLSGTNLIYRQFTASTTPASGPSCNVTSYVYGVPTITTWYESGAATLTRTALRNLTGATSSIFTIPATTTFSTCPSGGTVPTATTATAAAALVNLTVRVSVKPTTLNSAVTASDCGTNLRNHT